MLRNQLSLLNAMLHCLTQCASKNLSSQNKNNLRLRNIQDLLKGYKPGAGDTVESVNQLVAECEQSLEMEIQYHVPRTIKPDLSKARLKNVDVLLHRDRTGFGIVVRG